MRARAGRRPSAWRRWPRRGRRPTRCSPAPSGMADESRERAVAETRAEIERLREQATADIEPSVSARWPTCAARSPTWPCSPPARVVGETMTGQRERRLVDEFLARSRDASAAELQGHDGRTSSTAAATPRLPSRSPCVTATSSAWLDQLDDAARIAADDAGDAIAVRSRPCPFERRARRRSSTALGKDAGPAAAQPVAAAHAPPAPRADAGACGRRVPPPLQPAARASSRPPPPAPRRSPTTRFARCASASPAWPVPAGRSISNSPSTRHSWAASPVRLGDRLIDGSVRGRLERLRSQLAART